MLPCSKVVWDRRGNESSLMTASGESAVESEFMHGPGVLVGSVRCRGSASLNG